MASDERTLANALRFDLDPHWLRRFEDDRCDRPDDHRPRSAREHVTLRAIFVRISRIGIVRIAAVFCTGIGARFDDANPVSVRRLKVMNTHKTRRREGEGERQKRRDSQKTGLHSD